MGSREGRATMTRGFTPNGLLLNKADSIPKVLDLDRWSQAEERTAELLKYVQPTFKSEQGRDGVVSYLQRLITSSVSCQVFPLGSVPLKTYLPDGDIDLTALGDNQQLNNNFFNEVRRILESELKRSDDAEIRVKEVQFIQAEVKILKCLVENFVVDISFNQLGGLCTLCFLEEVDNLIGRNHLFKRSVILVKAWCYYESRILGAQHGLMSTYAVEALVIYIFHVYNGIFTGPLEVLYRFLEFFSKFDWNNYCISLWGPVPIRSLPNMRADRPRKDCRELLLSETFLNACMCCYGAMPSNQNTQEQPFVSKYLNIVDPLRANNNLGRSISKGNFFRIRSAINHGAQRLLRLLDCPEEKLIAEFDFFFKNTWDRNGNGYWIPFNQLNAINNSVKNSTHHERGDQQPQASDRSHEVYQKPATNLNESKHKFGTSDVSAVSEAGSSRTNSISTSTMTSDMMHAKPTKDALVEHGQSSTHSSNEVHAMPHFARVHTGTMTSDMKQKNPMTNAVIDQGQSSRHSSNEVRAMPHFARVHSIPESTPVSTQRRHTRVSGREGGQIHSASSMADNSRGSSSRHEVLDNQNIRVLPEDQQSFGQRSKGAVDLNDASNSYYGEFGMGVDDQNGYLVDEAMQMHKEEYAIMNTRETCRNPRFNGYLQAPVNVNTSNAPYFDSSWGQNMPYSQDSVPFPAMEWFPDVATTSNGEEFTEPYDYNVEVAHLDYDNSDAVSWLEQDVNNMRLYNGEDGNVQPQQESNRQMLVKGASTVRTNLADTSNLAGPPSENYGIFPCEFGPHEPPFPFPIMFPFSNLPTESFDVLDGDFATHWMNMQHGMICLHGQSPGPLLPTPSFVPPMHLQLLEQLPWHVPSTLLPSANMNIKAHCFPPDPMMPIGPVSGPHVGVNQPGAGELPRQRTGIGTYMPDPESYKVRFKCHEKKRNFRAKNWNFNYEYERGRDSDDESERNPNPYYYYYYNSHERFGNRDQFWRKPPPRQWIAINSGSSSSGTQEASEQGEGSYIASEEPAKLERDSADSSPQPSSPNISGDVKDSTNQQRGMLISSCLNQ